MHANTKIVEGNLPIHEPTCLLSLLTFEWLHLFVPCTVTESSLCLHTVLHTPWNILKTYVKCHPYAPGVYRLIQGGQRSNDSAHHHVMPGTHGGPVTVLQGGAFVANRSTFKRWFCLSESSDPAEVVHRYKSQFLK